LIEDLRAHSQEQIASFGCLLETGLPGRRPAPARLYELDGIANVYYIFPVSHRTQGVAVAAWQRELIL